MIRSFAWPDGSMWPPSVPGGGDEALATTATQTNAARQASTAMAIPFRVLIIEPPSLPVHLLIGGRDPWLETRLCLLMCRRWRHGDRTRSPIGPEMDNPCVPGRVNLEQARVGGGQWKSLERREPDPAVP